MSLGAREVRDPDGVLVAGEEALAEQETERGFHQLELVFLRVQAAHQRLERVLDVAHEGAVVFGEGVEELAQAAGHDGPGAVLQGLADILFTPAFLRPVAAAHGHLRLLVGFVE